MRLLLGIELFSGQSNNVWAQRRVHYFSGSDQTKYSPRAFFYGRIASNLGRVAFILHVHINALRCDL